MSVRCPQCGTENSSGKFCSNCGSQLPQVTQPAAAAQPSPPPFPPRPPQQPSPFLPQAPNQANPFPPQQPGPYPQQQMPAPPSGGMAGWVKWAIGGGVALVVVVGAIFAFSKPDPAPTPAPAPAPVVNNNKPTPAPTPAPANTTTGIKLSLVKRGALENKARGEFYAAWNNYLAEGYSNKALAYMFDKSGQAILARAISPTDAGQLLSVTVGDMLNTGKAVMVATYQTKIYVVVPQPGTEPEVIPNNGTTSVLIGDYDGDGKQETIFLGDKGFTVYRYQQGGDTKPIYSKTTNSAPPGVYQTPLKAGKVDMLFGYTWEGSNLFALLYKWDGAGGPVAIGKYPVSDSATAKWLSVGPSAAGPIFSVSRDGSPAQVEFFQVTSDAKSATSAGTMKADGTNYPAMVISQFTGGNWQALAVDGLGQYYLYDIAGK
jgi:hypothetical protein